MDFGIFKRPLWLGLLALVAAITGLLFLSHPSSIGKMRPIEDALFWQLSTPDLLPEMIGRAPGRPARKIQLPFFETRSQGGTLAHVAYAFTLSDDMLEVSSHGSSSRIDPPSQGLLFMQIINGGEFYLNGNWVAGLPRSNETQRWLWYRPFLVPLPPALLHHDGQPNVLTVVQASYEPYLILGRPYAGNLEDLGRVYEVALFFSNMLANASNLFCLAIGLFMLCAWLISPKEKIYALAGWGTIVWALLFMLALWRYMPISLYPLWRTTVFFGTGALVSLLTMFELAFIGEPLTKLNTRILLGYASLGGIIYLIGGAATENFLNSIWTCLLMLAYVYAFIRLTIHCIRFQTVQAIVLLAQSVLCIFLGFHDYAVLTGVMNELFPLGSTWTWLSILKEPIFLCHLALPFLWLAMGYVLLIQYQSQAKSVSNANKHLELSLQQREAELVKSYEQQKRLELAEATRAERDRIYQDVHDGIGSRLVSAMFSLRQGNANTQLIEANLKDCLADLRLVINAQTDEASDIQSAVFEHCLQQEAHLDGSDLVFSYDVWEGPPLHLSPQMHLNILRILQESMTNAIKHSQATEMQVKLEQCEQALLLTVADNGKGLGVAADPLKAGWYGESGKRGLVGMYARAKAIGAEFSLARVGAHTLATLRLPLPGN